MIRYFVFILCLLPFSLQAEECPRIISQSPYITHTLEWMGLKQCIVGTSRYDTLGLPTTGGVLDPDAEAIDSLMPDIIFTSDWTKAEVLEKVTPRDASSYRLLGFQSMAQVEENIRIIAKATQRQDLLPLADQFHQQWLQAAKQINGKNKKVVLLSSCSGMPYSFGKNSWLHDLFTQAGFQVVETAEHLRHIRPGNEIADLTHYLDTFQPDLLLIFQRSNSKQCQLITPKLPVKIHTLEGEHFLHPAPVLLKGLAELKTVTSHM